MATKEFKGTIVEPSGTDTVQRQVFDQSITFTEEYTERTPIADTASKTLTAFGSITTVKLVIIVSDQIVEFYVPQSAATAGDLDTTFIFFGNLDSVKLTNNSGSTANVQVFAYGD